MLNWRQLVRERLPRMSGLPPAREAEILEELAELLEDTYAHARHRGLGHDEALARALAQLPDGAALARRIEQAERPVAGRLPPDWRAADIGDQLIRTRRGNMLNAIWQDIRYGLRMLAKSPGFTAVAIVTLALGIGANTAIFSVVEAILLRPLQYRDPERLVIVWEHNFKRDRKTNVAGPANFMRWRERSQSFEKLSAFVQWDVNVIGLGEPERVTTGLVTADYFETLGVQARMGRVFGPEHAQSGEASNVVVLTDGYWKRRFGADPRALGKTFTLSGSVVTVIGVMPPDFRGLMNVDLFTPLVLTERHRNARGRYMVPVGRLKPGVSRDQAQGEMAGIARQIEGEIPDFTGGWGVNIVPLREQLVGSIRTTLWVLFGAVGFVLLIACANLANLLLARATNRQRELAVRAAIGASRGQLVRQLLVESVLLSLVGGAAGALVAVWAVGALPAILPPDVNRFTQVQLNPVIFAFTALLALGTGLVFGVVPALTATGAPLQESLKEGTAGAGGGRRRLRSLLVVSEVALSLVLLAGAGLLLKSFAKLSGIDAGFESGNVLSMQVSLAGQQYSQAAQIAQFYDRALEGIRAVPGVVSAGGISWQLMGIGSATSYGVVGEPPAKPGQETGTEVRIVTPHLLETLRIPLLRGRLFSEQDTREAPCRVVINEALARESFPGRDPLGQRIWMSWGGTCGVSGDGQLAAEVIGVVGDVRLVALDTAPRATTYWALAQISNNFMTLMVRSTGDPSQLSRAIKDKIAAVDPQLPVAKVQLLSEVRSQSLKPRRFTLLLLGIFAGVAVTLAAVGIYGVMAYSVSQRTREIGIRMALGAQRGDVLSLVLRHGALLAGVGVAIGLGLALGLSRFLSTLVFEVSVTDPLTYAAVVALLGAIAVAACLVPAGRAARVDPLVALRHE